METNFNFKSQPCTPIEQSKRLLALGLKKETADMALIENWDYDLKDGKFFTGEYFERPIDYTEGMTGHYIPAWSLHRLLSILNEDDSIIDITVKDGRYGIHYGYDTEWYDDLYDGMIAVFGTLIKEGYFPEEYLV